MGGSSGGVPDAAFKGSLRLHLPDGRTIPATAAWVEVESDLCPGRRQHALPLGPEGRFEDHLSLTTDTERYCVRGLVESTTTLEPVDLRLSVTGCEDAVVSFAGEPGEAALEMRCAAMEPGLEPLPRPQRSPKEASLGVSLDDKGLFVAGTVLTLPTTVARLRLLLGSPSLELPAKPGSDGQELYEWQACGVAAYAKRGEVNAIDFVLDPELNSRNWCNSGYVTFTMNGVQITSGSDSAEIARAGFPVEDSWKKQVIGTLYALLWRHLPDKGYGEIEVGLRSQDGV
jgi:hypothetical protein